MKSRTSFFNGTVLRKDITRFAPSWALYTVFLLLSLFTMVTNNSPEWLAEDLADSLPVFAVLNFLYAFLNAQLLFGDLFKSRMCNALHAMPLRREGWFLTHVICGNAFALIPNLLAGLIMALLLGKLWFIPLLVVLGSALQYLFFFGLATFSCLCAGNRFAVVLIYGILNFLSLLIFWLSDILYEPLLYGVVFDAEPLLKCCPVVWMASRDYLRVDNDYIRDGVHEQRIATFEGFEGGSWLYLVICAVLGIGLLALALQLYRKRHLEAAGDFIAVKAMEPVFLVIYAVTLGAMLQLFYMVATGNDLLLFLVIGVAVGFFTGQMLLKRTVKVFQKKSFLGLAALLVILALSLLFTKLDLGNVIHWVPEAADVKTVVINPNGYYSSWSVTDPEDIVQVLDMHSAILGVYDENDGDVLKNNVYYYDGGNYTTVTLRYEMKSGTVRERTYTITVDSYAGQALKRLLSDPECVFGYDNFEKFLADLQSFTYNNKEYLFFRKEDKEAFARALWKDAENGDLYQNLDFYYAENVKWYTTWLYLNLDQGESREIRITLDAQNILDRLYSFGYLEDLEFSDIQPSDWRK